MATVKKKTKKKKSKVKYAKYDPTAPSYKSTGDINAAAHRLAQGKIQPGLDELGYQQRTEQGKTATRNADLNSWYQWAGKGMQDSFDKTSAALNTLIGTQGANNQQAQGQLQASLNANRAQQSGLANTIGGSAVGAGDQDAAVLNAATAGGAMNQAYLSGQARALTASSGERIGTAGIGARNALDKENDRLTAALEQIRGQRKDLMAQLPGLEEDARNELSDNELKKQSQRFQQELAGKQFDRSAYEFDAGLDAQNAAAGVEAGDKKATALAEQKKNAHTWLATYLAPRQGEADYGVHWNKADPDQVEAHKGLHMYDSKARSFKGALMGLRGEVGMSKTAALNVLLRSSSPHFRASARAELRRMKDPKKYKAEQGAVKAGNDLLKNAGKLVGGPKKYSKGKPKKAKPKKKKKYSK